MNHAIRVHEYGGPEKMVWEEVPLPAPKPGEALVRHQAVGLNYIDVYFRTGLYKAPSLPATIGMEGAGIVEAVGEGVTNVAPGDRVAYATGPIGAYAEARAIKADRLVKVPEAIALEQAAAMMLQGMTACFLLTRTYKVQPGQTILIHAAAGGVGLIMTQWAKHLGCTVIGCVSTEEKAALAKAHGADHTVIGIEGLPARVREITGGAMLPVVFDSVGRDTFTTSLDCLAPYGMMVSYGNASGPAPAVLPGLRQPLHHLRTGAAARIAGGEDGWPARALRPRQARALRPGGAAQAPLRRGADRAHRQRHPAAARSGSG
jgi:NADPH2:quinone reductase